MKTLDHSHRASALPLVVVTLIVLGAGALAWEWHSAHPANHKHNKVTSLAHHHAHHMAAAVPAAR